MMSTLMRDLQMTELRGMPGNHRYCSILGGTQWKAKCFTRQITSFVGKEHFSTKICIYVYIYKVYIGEKITITHTGNIQHQQSATCNAGFYAETAEFVIFFAFLLNTKDSDSIQVRHWLVKHFTKENIKLLHILFEKEKNLSGLFTNGQFLKSVYSM